MGSITLRSPWTWAILVLCLIWGGWFLIPPSYIPASPFQQSSLKTHLPSTSDDTASAVAAAVGLFPPSTSSEAQSDVEIEIEVENNGEEVPVDNGEEVQQEQSKQVENENEEVVEIAAQQTSQSQSSAEDESLQTATTKQSSNSEFALSSAIQTDAAVLSQSAYEDVAITTKPVGGAETTAQLDDIAISTTGFDSDVVAMSSTVEEGSIETGAAKEEGWRRNVHRRRY